MTTSALPAFMLKMETDLAALLPNVIVTLGQPITSDPRGYLMIGIDDPETTSAATGASFNQDWSTTGLSAFRSESGTVTCAACDGNSDGDMRAAITSAAALVSATETWARTASGSSLGIGSLEWAHVTGAEVFLSQNSSGATALFVFTVAYEANLD